MLYSIGQNGTLEIIRNLDDEITTTVHVGYISDVFGSVDIKNVNTGDSMMLASDLAHVISTHFLL
jgi:hypothetical protein